MSYFGSTDYLYETSAGNTDAASGFIIARNPTIGTTATETLWDYGGNYTYLTANTQLYISSSSASDTSVSLVLTGVDDDYAPIVLTATCTGQTQVAFSAATAFRVFTCAVIGSTGAVGNLYIAESDTLTAGVPDTASKVKALIPLGTATDDTTIIDTGTDYASDNITHLGLYTVPAGKKMIVPRIIVGTNKNDDVKISGRVRPFGGSWLNRNPIPIYQSNAVISFAPPLLIPEKADIEFRAVASAIDSLAQAQLFFTLEDA